MEPPTNPGRFNLPLAPRDDGPFRKIAILDVETAGIDPVTIDVRDVAVVTLDIDPEGETLGIVNAGQALRDPHMPIPPKITKLTGIRDEDVCGKSISTTSRVPACSSHNCTIDAAFF